MWTFILRSFAQSDASQRQDLDLLRESRFCGHDIPAGKLKLSELILNDSLPADRFYQFEGSNGGEPQFSIAFYLFENHRLCPVRIWNRRELYGKAAPGPIWMVDFNGIPSWSAIIGVDPSWRQAAPSGNSNGTIGRSSRDWQKRSCWKIDPPDTDLSARPPLSSSIQASVLVAKSTVTSSSGVFVVPPSL